MKVFCPALLQPFSDNFIFVAFILHYSPKNGVKGKTNSIKGTFHFRLPFVEVLVPVLLKYLVSQNLDMGVFLYTIAYFIIVYIICIWRDKYSLICTPRWMFIFVNISS